MNNRLLGFFTRVSGYKGSHLKEVASDFRGVISKSKRTIQEGHQVPDKPESFVEAISREGLSTADIRRGYRNLRMTGLIALGFFLFCIGRLVVAQGILSVIIDLAAAYICLALYIPISFKMWRIRHQRMVRLDEWKRDLLKHPLEFLPLGIK